MYSKSQWVRLATYASVATALILMVIKFTAWLQTDSISILASLLDSALDIVASVMIAIAVIIAQIPPDTEHRFGHGKAEPLAALAQSIFIFGSALYLIIYTIERIIEPQAIQNPETAMLYMSVTLTITFVLIAFQRFVIIKTNSTAIRADSLHYISDIGSNILVLIGLWFSQLPWIDPLFALLIALFILKSAFGIAKDSANQLLDRELPESDRKAIQKVILNTPGVCGFNDLRTYQSGPNRFVQFDLELDDEISLKRAHTISEQVTKNLKNLDSDFDIMIHQEPVSLQNDPEHHNWGKN